MNKILKQLLLVYFILILIKIILSYFIPSPMAFDDCLEYARIARNFFVNNTFSVDSGFSRYYMPFYPFLLSFAYIFKNMEIVYFFMKVINALLSSLIIFPSWLFAKEFLSKRKSLKMAILISILPSMFVFSFYIMGENVLYTLLLFSIYFLYKSLTTKNYKWDILAGIFIGLSYLTKITSILLVVLVGIIIITNLVKKDFLQIRNKIILLITSFIVVSYWIFKDIYDYGFNICGIFHYCELSIEIKTGAKFNWIILKDFLYFFGSNLVYIIMALGIIFFILIVSFIYYKSDIIFKDEKLKSFCFLNFLVLFLTLFLVSLYNFHNPNPMERYMAYLYPLILILSFLSLKKDIVKLYNTKKIFFICLSLSILFVIFYKINSFQLFPMNNMSLAHIGLINFILDKFLVNYKILIGIILFIVIPWIILLFYKMNLFTFKKLFLIFLIFFILLSSLNYAMVYYNSNYRWNTLDQMKLGKWFNEFDKGKSKVLFDKRDFESFKYDIYEDKMDAISKKAHMPNYIMAFWMNNEILFDYFQGDLEIDYIISSQTLNFSIINQNGDIDNPIYIYKVK